MSTYKRVPPSDVQPVDESRRWTTDWYDIIKRLDQLQPLSDIPPDTTFGVTGVTPGSNASTVTASPITDGNSGAAGVAHSYIGINTAGGSAALQAQADSFTTLVVQNNNLRADLVSAQTAIAGLNTRLSDTVTKLNAVIADLHARFP
jgi:flagellin-like hook-associated protein FlgL